MTKRPALFLAISLGFLASIAFVACGNANFGNGSQTDAGPSSDATSAEGGSQTDANAIDSSPDGAALDFCSSLAAPHDFCDSFDEAGIASVWFTGAPCKSPSLDPNVSLSAPQSLSAATTVEQCSTMITRAGALPSSTAITCDLQAKLDKPGTSPMTFFDIKGTSAFEFRSVDISLTYDHSSGAPVTSLVTTVVYDDGGSDQQTVPLSSTISGTDWAHVQLAINLKAGTILVTLNGTPVSSQFPGLPSVVKPAQFVIVLGVTANPPVTAHFDNLFCETSD